VPPRLEALVRRSMPGVWWVGMRLWGGRSNEVVWGGVR
jgi:hypothetical protein